MDSNYSLSDIAAVTDGGMGNMGGLGGGNPFAGMGGSGGSEMDMLREMERQLRNK